VKTRFARVKKAYPPAGIDQKKNLQYTPSLLREKETRTRGKTLNESSRGRNILSPYDSTSAGGKKRIIGPIASQTITQTRKGSTNTFDKWGRRVSEAIKKPSFNRVKGKTGKGQKTGLHPALPRRKRLSRGWGGGVEICVGLGGIVESRSKTNRIKGRGSVNWLPV